MKKSSIIVGLIVICLACSVLVSCSQDIKNFIVGTWQNIDASWDTITFFSNGRTDYDDGYHGDNVWKRESSDTVGVYPFDGEETLRYFKYNKETKTLTDQLEPGYSYVKIH